MDRPAFLQMKHENGASLIAAFRGLGQINQKVEVDKWLVWANCYGSMTWQERCLFDAIENGEDID